MRSDGQGLFSNDVDAVFDGGYVDDVGDGGYVDEVADVVVGE